MATLVEERRFSLSNVDGGNNKFWNIKLFDDGSVECHWGLQGASGQRKTFHPPHKKSGRAGFEAQIREKTSDGHTNGAYVENKVLDAPRAATPAGPRVTSREHVRSAAQTQIAKGSPLLMNLVDYLTDVNVHQITEWSGGQIRYDVRSGLFQTTQGVITLDQINEARRVLDRIAQFAAQQDFVSQDFKVAVGRYLALVPQAGKMRSFNLPQMFGMGKGGGLAHQGTMLDSLASSYASVVSQPVGDKKADKKPDQPSLFRVELEPVVRDCEEFDTVRAYYTKTKGTHGDVQDLDVKKVFTLRIADMATAFLKKGIKYGNVMRLWHGTMPSNVLSILKGGMHIPSPGGCSGMGCISATSPQRASATQRAHGAAAVGHNAFSCFCATWRWGTCTTRLRPSAASPLVLIPASPEAGRSKPVRAIRC